MTCLGPLLIGVWINAVALKAHEYPILWYWSDYRMKVAVAYGPYICVGGEET